MIAALTLATSPLMANPIDGTVVAGGATITAPNGKTILIAQHTDKVAIDWRGFSIAADELTQFAQPGAASIALNRVTGGNASLIDGALKANGQVWLINPAGIAFGSTAQVDVSGLLATTSDISNSNFMAGNYSFDKPGNPDAAVTNAGTITIGDAGLGALVAPWVRNDGVISADLGTVVLGTGETFALDFVGDGLVQFEVGGTAQELVQSGRLSADGGSVLLTAADASAALGNVINMTGIVEARTVASAEGSIVLDGGTGTTGGGVTIAGTLDASGTDAGEVGGDITVTGEETTLTNTAALDVSGDMGGGDIKVGGGFQGQGPTPTAENTTVATGATLKADAITKGEGGEIIVWADGTTSFDGHISARGGAQSGDGGFAEVSGKDTLAYTGLADLRALNGATGTLLLDPTNFTIGVAEATTITNNLVGANVVIATDTAGVEDGDIFVNAAIIYSSANDLTLLAHDDIEVNASVQNDGAGALTLVGGWDGMTEAPVSGGINSPAAFSLATLLGTASSFGNNDGDVNIGDGNQTAGIAVGSRFGTTTVLSDYLTIRGSDTTDDAFAQLGIQVSNSGAAFTINGAIDVRTKGNIIAQGGSNAGAYVQIGHVGTDFAPDNSTVEATVNAAISISTAGGLTFAGGTGEDAYAQLGHGGYFAHGAFAGDITVAVANDLSLTSGDPLFGFADAGIGHAGSGGAREGGIDIQVGGLTTMTAGAGGDPFIGHITSTVGGISSADVALVTNGLSVIGGNPAGLLAKNLSGGNVLIANTATGANSGILITGAGLALLDTSNDLTLAARGAITFGDSVQNDGPGYIGIVAGWDGTTGLDVSVFPTLDVGVIKTAGAFGAAGGDVNIGDGTQGSGIAVGSRRGTMTVLAEDLTLRGSNMTNEGFAQLGFQASNKGEFFFIDGDIDVATKGNITAQAGAGSGAYAQIGHVGGDYTPDNTVEAMTDAAISVSAGGNVTFTGRGNSAYAQLGHGGYEADGNHSGAITVASANDLSFVAAGNDYAYAQFGHGGAFATGNHSGAISIVSANNLIFEGGPVLGAYAQLGHGGFDVDGDHSGAIIIASANDLIFEGGGDEGGGGDNTYVQLGHGGFDADGDHSGAITINSANNLTFEGGRAQASYAQLGHGGAIADGKHFGDITIASANELSFMGGRGDFSYAQVGHGGAAAVGDRSGVIAINVTNDLRFTGGSGDLAYVQLGHGGGTADGDYSGDVVIDSANDLSFTGGSGSNNSYAQLGHGGFDADGNHSGAITIASANDLSLTGGSGPNNSYAQLGHGGNDADGNHSGDITVAQTNDLTVLGGAGVLASGQIGHGGAFSLGNKSGSITLSGADNVDVVGGQGVGALALVGHGGAFAKGSMSGDINVTAGDDSNVFGGAGNGAMGQIGHRGGSAGDPMSGSVNVQVADTLEITGGSGDLAYAQIGHGGLAGTGDITGEIDISVGTTLDVAGGSGSDAYAQIGHGDFTRQGTGVRSGNVDVVVSGLTSLVENVGGFFLGHRTGTPNGLMNADLSLTTGGLSVTGSGFEQSLQEALSGSIVTVTNTAAQGTANSGITLLTDINGPDRGSLVLRANGDVTTQGLSGMDLVSLFTNGDLTLGAVSNVQSLAGVATNGTITRLGDIGSAGNRVENLVLVASQVPGGPFILHADTAFLSGLIGDRSNPTLANSVRINVGSLTLSGPSVLVGGFVGGLTAQPGADLAALFNPTGRLGFIGEPPTSDHLLVDPTTGLLYVIEGLTRSADDTVPTVTSSEPQNAGARGLGSDLLIVLGGSELLTASLRDPEDGDGVPVPLGPGACGGALEETVAAIAGIFFSDVNGACGGSKAVRSNEG